MRIVDWIASHPDEAIAVGGAVAAWLGVKRRDASYDRHLTRIASAARTEAWKILADSSRHAQLEGDVKSAARAAMGKLGVPDRLYVALVEPLVEEVIAEAYGRLIELQLGDIAKRAREIADSIPPRAPG